MKWNYQGTGIGTKVIEVMKKKCIKYDFSLSLVSGSVRFNKKIYKSSLHDCNQGTFYVNQFKKNNKFRKIGIVAGMNPRHWEQMTEFESEIVIKYAALLCVVLSNVSKVATEVGFPVGLFSGILNAFTVAVC